MRGEIRKSVVTAQQHRTCFVIGLLMCKSTLRRPLSRICGTAEQLRLWDIFFFGSKLDSYEKV